MYIGCSGFHYREWRTQFYPPELPPTRWMGYYWEHFNSLELNVTFYQFPELKILKGWKEKSPDQSLISMKVPRLITHYHQFRTTDDLLGNFYDSVRTGLQEKTGAILFKLPGQLTYSEALLERLVNALDPEFTNVVEFRHLSWWTDPVRETLRKNGIIFCGLSLENLPDEIMNDLDTVYYRFHGRPQMYRSFYSDDELKEVADAILASPGIMRAFLYFNNTASGAAFRNAIWLNTYCRKSGPILPKLLF